MSAATSSARQQRTLKPLLEIGAAVHSAYWDADDPAKPATAAPKPAAKKKPTLKNMAEGARIYVQWKSARDLYKATVKETFKDKGKAMVRIHYDGKKKTSLDAVPLSRVQGFITDTPDSSESDSDDEGAEWYPGVISGRRVGAPDDPRYGPVILYDVHFDDGDEITGVPDSYVLPSEEFHLVSREDDPGHEWTGVQNIMDEGSKDKWAKEVGWYTASLPGGGERTFSFLSDALRAYDAAVLQQRGTKAKPSELNLPEEWGTLLGDAKSQGRTKGEAKREHELAVREGKEWAKEQMERAEEQHDLEIARLTSKFEDEKEVAVKDAVDAEKRRGREELSQLKKELRGKVETKLDALREKYETEKEELKEVLGEGKRKGSVKLNLQVGEEVYAAWWPNGNDDEEATWFLGRVKSYREVPTDDESYGPTRVYTIKYTDDGSELEEVEEHYVFPKEDYLLSVDLPSNHQWKGVRNVVDKKADCEWAKKVGWYVASIASDEGDGVDEVTFPRLSEALRAYDASIVRRKGDKARRTDLNIPDDWAWLFAKAGVKPPKTYTEEELKDVVNEEAQKESERVARKLEAKHAKEMKTAVEEAVNEAVARERKLKESKLAEVKTKSQKRVAAAVEEALEKERKGRESKFKEMRTKYERAKAAAVAEAKEEAVWKEASLHEAMDEAVRAAAEKARRETLEEARRTQELEKDVVRSLQMEGLRGQFQREKEVALRQLREELEAKHWLEMDALKAKPEGQELTKLDPVSSSSRQEDANGESQSTDHKRPAVDISDAEESAKAYSLDVLPGSLPPPKKRGKAVDVSPNDESQCEDENLMGSRVSPTELIVKPGDGTAAQGAAVAGSLENSPQAIPDLSETAYLSQVGQMQPPPFANNLRAEQPRSQHELADQSAGERTTEGQCAHQQAVDALLVAAGRRGEIDL